MSERVNRINGYLRMHELRLKSLAQAGRPGRAIPIAEIERERRVKVVVKPDPTLHIEQYDIVMI